jgi:hypothetical protein
MSESVEPIEVQAVPPAGPGERLAYWAHCCSLGGLIALLPGVGLMIACTLVNLLLWWIAAIAALPATVGVVLAAVAFASGPVTRHTALHAAFAIAEAALIGAALVFLFLMAIGTIVL